MTKEQKIVMIQEELEALGYLMDKTLSVIKSLKRMESKEANNLGTRFEEKLRVVAEEVIGDIEMIYDKIDGV